MTLQLCMSVCFKMINQLLVRAAAIPVSAAAVATINNTCHRGSRLTAALVQAKSYPHYHGSLLVRCLSTGSSSSSSSSVPSTRTTATTKINHRRRDEIDLTFRNTAQAFKSKRTSELIRAIIVLTLSKFDILVYNYAIVS